MATILIVEDNELNRDMLSRRLIKKGYQIEQITRVKRQGFKAGALKDAMPFANGKLKTKTKGRSQRLCFRQLILATQMAHISMENGRIPRINRCSGGRSKIDHQAPNKAANSGGYSP